MYYMEFTIEDNTVEAITLDEIKKPRKQRISKMEFNKKEQVDIAKKIINILDPSGNNTFTLYQVDNNENQKKDIMDMLPEIKKCVPLNTIRGGYNVPCKRAWLSVTRQVLKKAGYNIVRKDIMMKKNNNTNDYVKTVKCNIVT
jgi:hypothetical protein